MRSTLTVGALLRWLADEKEKALRDGDTDDYNALEQARLHFMRRDWNELVEEVE